MHETHWSRIESGSNVENVQALLYQISLMRYFVSTLQLWVFNISPPPVMDRQYNAVSIFGCRNLNCKICHVPIKIAALIKTLLENSSQTVSHTSCRNNNASGGGKTNSTELENRQEFAMLFYVLQYSTSTRYENDMGNALLMGLFKW